MFRPVVPRNKAQRANASARDRHPRPRVSGRRGRVAVQPVCHIAALPTLEIHLSDVHTREAWRRTSVISDLCFATISGSGPDGYSEALALLRKQLDGERA